MKYDAAERLELVILTAEALLHRLARPGVEEDTRHLCFALHVRTRQACEATLRTLGDAS